MTKQQAEEQQKDIKMEIDRLTEEFNELNAFTADGHHIEPGMTLYAIDYDGIERYVVTNDAKYKLEYLDFGSFTHEYYTDLYVSLDKAKEAVLHRVKDALIRAERTYHSLQERYEKAEENTENSIKSWDCKHQNYQILDSTAIISVVHRARCNDCGAAFTIDEGY